MVSEIGLGGIGIGLESVTDSTAFETINSALLSGVNYLDTAPYYGHSERRIGDALKASRGSVLLSTKVGRWDWETGPYFDMQAFKTQFSQSLDRLRTSYVDILFIHEADWLAFWVNSEVPRTRKYISTGEQIEYASQPILEFCQWAVEKKMAQHIGISGNNAHLLAHHIQSDFPYNVILVASQQSLLWRNAESTVFPLALSHDTGIILGGIFQQGKLAMAHPEWVQNPPDWMDADLHQRYVRLLEIATSCEVTLPELAIRFLLSRESYSTALVGCQSPEEMDGVVNFYQQGSLNGEIDEMINQIGRVFEGVRGIDYWP